MNHTKLIHQFFDGEIKGADEEALFSALAGDRELRREFVEHLQIASFIQHDTSRTGPPAEVSNAVFAAIGLPQPGAPFAQPEESTWQKLGVLFQRILPFLATIFITGAVTSGVILLSDHEYYNPDSAAPAVQMQAAQSEQIPTAASPESPAESATHEGTTAANESVPAREYAHTEVSQNPPAGTSRPHQTGTAAAPEPSPVVHKAVPGPGAETMYARHIDASPVAEIRLAPVTVHPNPPLMHNEMQAEGVLFDMPFGQTPFSLANVIFQLRVVALQGAYPNTGLTAPNQGIFRDMAITGLYKLSERHALGISYGREPIGRIYARMVEVVDPVVGSGPNVPKEYISVEFRDYDMLDWGGVTWKMSYTNLGLLRTFYPFTEFTAAVSKYGPIGRAMAGIELYPSNNSMINLGIELTSLGFKIEDKYYTSNKLGGSFGVALTF